MLREGNGFLANMAKRLVQDRSKHSLSYGLIDIGRGLKPDSSESHSGTMRTTKEPGLFSVNL
jgi:hypothetical protein